MPAGFIGDFEIQVLYQPIKLLPEGSVLVREVLGSMKRDSRVQELIDAGWKRETDRMTRLGWKFYDGPMVRFEGFEANNEGVQVRVSPSISYKDVIGLRAHPYSSFRDFSEEMLPKAITSLSILTTMDNKIMLGLRKTGDWLECYELSGGFVKPENSGDSFASILYWLQKDAEVLPMEVADRKFCGLLYFPFILEAMLVFVTRLSVSSEEIVERNRNTDSIHSDFLFMDDTPEAWENLKKSGVPLHPPSSQCMDLYMKTWRGMMFVGRVEEQKVS